MLKELGRSDLDRLLETISADYSLQVPLQLADGTRQLGPYGSAETALFGPRVQRKPTAFFFPQTEQLLSFAADGQTQLPVAPAQPFALFGLDRSDLAAIAFLDRFFNAAPADDVYLKRRTAALLIGLTGRAGEKGNLLPLSGKNCDLELIAERPGETWLARGYSTRGKALLAGHRAAEPARLEALFQQSQPDEQVALAQAARLLQEDKIPDSFWEEIAARCILCCGCNFACPTCSCFCVQDRTTAGGSTERSRVWDSCQLDAFMREASGHNPLGTEALRTRRRIHHKLVADVERWGEIGCFGCGRCDRSCPTGIGMLAVVEEIVKRFGAD